MKHPWICMIIALCGALLPVAALAQTSAAAQSNAGFATQSVFLSRSSVTVGDTVSIYTSVTNPSDVLFRGTLQVKSDTGFIGSAAVELGPGEARVVSVSWTPEKSGTGIVTAELDDAGGAKVGETSAGFTVQARPANEPPPAPSAIELSTPIERAVTSVYAPADAIVAPVLSAVDGARGAVTRAIDGQILRTKALLPGAASSTSAAGLSTGSLVSTGFGVIWMIYFYVLTVLRFIIGSLAFFYPLLAILIIWSFYRLYRRMSAPRY